MGVQAAQRSPAVTRAVIYAPYSCDQQRAASIDDPIRLCFARIKREGWTLTRGHVGFSGTMGALFIAKLAGVTHRGQHGRVEKGFASGVVSFGYAVAPRNDEDGKVVAGVPRVFATEAAVVRRILRDYADGVSPRKIAAALNLEGIKSPRDKDWAASTINGNRRRRGTGILNTKLYVGVLVWNRLEL